MISRQEYPLEIEYLIWDLESTCLWLESKLLSFNTLTSHNTHDSRVKV